MIPTKPPPTFRESDRWSPQFIDFVSRCLIKTPESRATASQLLQSDFIGSSKSCQILQEMIVEAAELRDNPPASDANSDQVDSGTMLPGDQGTLVSLNDGTFVNHPTNLDLDGTMIQYAEDGTMVKHDTGPGSAISRTLSEVESNLGGTMVINEEEEEEEDSTMKQYGTAPGGSKYRPQFLHHFDKKEKEEEKKKPVADDPGLATGQTPASQQSNHLSKQSLQRQLQQIAGQNLSVAMSQPLNPLSSDKFHRSINEGDFEFLKLLPYEELTMRMGGLDSEMEKEIEDLRRRYNAKRQPILDAMDQKRKRQQNF